MLLEAQMFSIKEVAKFLNLSKRTVQRLISSGELPAYTVSSSKRISSIDLERYLRGETVVDPRDESWRQTDLF